MKTTTTSFNWYGVSKRFSNAVEQEQEDEQENYEEQENEEVETNHKTVDDIDPDQAYSMFADSYEQATGKAWDKSKFLHRANNWIFFGDENGYIAVRPQRSGLYKLVGIAGDPNNPIAKGKAIIKGFSELMAEGKPVWGCVSSDLKAMAERMGMKSPPPVFISRLLKYIPGNVFGNANISQVYPDGGIQIEYADIGTTKKYFIANNIYFEWLKSNIETNEQIPRPAKFILKKMLDRASSTISVVKIASKDSFVKNYIDIIEC